MTRRRDAGTATPAVAVLTASGVPFTLHPYDHDPTQTRFGDEASAALGVAPERIFKTLIVSLQGARSPLGCAVVPVAAQLDLRVLAHLAGAKKAALADAALAERTTGYIVGGISPLGQKRALTTWVDASARAWPTVFVSAGRRGLQVELSPDDLVRLTAADVATLARG
ncbi:MAG TPA: Cys-tRNA(Pro) deacylase [Propionibacteriaceae bacterium]|nr:Cys-tRNA(Pro) deacylase [Propionibacteriaceae bacterium]